MNNKKSIAYINFSPYENAGRILDFILDNFELVVLFSFNFHNLEAAQMPGKVKIYKKGHLENELQLIDMPFRIPSSFTFLLLPVRSFINFLQILWYLKKIKNQYGKIDIYFTVNAFTAWVGNIAKSFGLVNKTIFWVWDYYPPFHSSKIVLLMRWLYWQFDKAATTSDRLIFMNKKLENLRKDINIIPRNRNYPIVAIGTDPITRIKSRNKNKIVIGFLAVLKKSQGLDLFFDLSDKIHKKFPNLELEIIGSGPDEKHFRRRAQKSLVPVKFLGFLPDDKKVKEVQLGWDIGIALYVPEESNVSYYTDPSKIKGYLSLSIPVIITDVAISEEINKENAGIVINYYNKPAFINGISRILSNYSNYQKGALRMAKKYYYKKIYPRLFEL